MKIEMKPTKYEVEIADYGKFFISPLGAGAESEIRIAMREIESQIEDNKKYDKFVKAEENGEEIDRNSEEYKQALEAYKETGKKVDYMRDITLEKLRYVIKGDNADKLFNDFTYDQIMEIYTKAVKK